MKSVWNIWFNDGKISKSNLDSKKILSSDETDNSSLEQIDLSYFIQLNSLLVFKLIV